MLKGVNRQVIEINDTGSRYFERAILIVRPEFFGESGERLRSDASKLLGNYGRPPATGAAHSAAQSAAHSAARRFVSKKQRGRRLRPQVKRAVFWALTATIIAAAVIVAVRFI